MVMRRNNCAPRHAVGGAGGGDAGDEGGRGASGRAAVAVEERDQPRGGELREDVGGFGND